MGAKLLPILRGIVSRAPGLLPETFVNRELHATFRLWIPRLPPKRPAAAPPLPCPASPPESKLAISSRSPGSERRHILQPIIRRWPMQVRDTDAATLSP